MASRQSALANAAKAENSARRAAKLFEVPVAVVNDAIAFERSLMAGVKVVIDKNLSPALARALNALFAGDHEVIHVRDRFGPNVKDVEWIARLSDEGRWIVVSGDTNIVRRKAEQAAFRNSRLIGFFLAPALNASKVSRQMHRLLALWDDFEIIASRVEGGAMYELPIKGKYGN